MFEPIRGGTRGGQGEFKWSDVSADKDREHYLGHSVNAPTGRWQKNKDVHWYNRETADTEAERREEIRKIKEAEAEALSLALGFAPTAKGSTSEPSTSQAVEGKEAEPTDTAAQKEEKRRKKLERKEERRAHKEQKRAAKEREHRHSRHRRSSRSVSRSRSPPRRSREAESSRRRDYDDEPRPRHRDASPRREPTRSREWGRR